MWTFYDNPPLRVASVDFYQLLAIVGNGVDFFFVISGFCMYLMTYKKSFDLHSYLKFLMKRFTRIAPAFYTAVLLYAFVVKYYDVNFNYWYNVLFHFIFLNNVVTGNTISPPFWSIGTEWHFYMILPVFIYLSSRLSLIKSVVLFSCCSIILLCFVHKGYLSADWWDSQVLVRFPEFGVGIIACYYYVRNKNLPRHFKGLKGIFFAVLIMYAGRMMRFTPILENVGSMSFIFRSIADTVMTSGFGLLVFHTITNTSIVSTFLTGRFITYLGRISFSVYLWHSLVIIFCTSLLDKINLGALNPVAGFLLISIITILLSHFSYKYLEAFYFKNKIETTSTTLITEEKSLGKVG